MKWVKPLYDPCYDPLWAVLQDLEIIVNVHSGTGNPDYGPYPASMLLYINEVPFYSQRPFVQMVLSGVFERFPRLKFVMTEAGCAWVPPMLERLDHVIRGIRETGAIGEMRYGAEHVLPRSATRVLPAELLDGREPARAPTTPPPGTPSASTSSCGAATTRTTRAPTPSRGSTCASASSDAPEAELRQILAGNAAKLYDFDLDALAPLAARSRPDRRRDRHADRGRARQGAPADLRGHGLQGHQVSAPTSSDYGASNPSAKAEPADGSRPSLVIVDDPAPGVRRITLNRPEKRNALNHPLRGELLAALRAADADAEVKVSIMRGAGHQLLGRLRPGRRQRGPGDAATSRPAATGQWPRHVTEGWMSIWDLAKPVIAQVHGYCLAGGSELATGCDLVYVAEDAKMGYPAVRFGVPDMQFHAWFLGMRAAMEMMVTGDSISGDRGGAAGLGQPGVPGGRARRARCVAGRPAHRPGPLRHRAAQQAHGAPGHGGHGPAHAPSARAPSCAPSAPTRRASASSSRRSCPRA